MSTHPDFVAAVRSELTDWRAWTARGAVLAHAAAAGGRKVEERTSGLIITAIVLAGLVAVSVFGNGTYFGAIVPPPLNVAMIAPALLVVVTCGLAGGFFSRLLITSLLGGGGRLSQWRAGHPVAFAAGCGLAVALIGVATAGATFGSGYAYTSGLLAGESQVPVLNVLLSVDHRCWVAGGQCFLLRGSHCWQAPEEGGRFHDHPEARVHRVRADMVAAPALLAKVGVPS